ncbi:MAG: alpha amylase C-terminal domain-containing protein, partial [Clostridia bacterium]|nr:alpha amylase C-terminal domain-containing protein [Clostridia bacterium]
RVFPLPEKKWRDRCWMESRKNNFLGEKARKQPISIYELHIPSWKRRSDGCILSYTELADHLAPYLLQMGYTHVEIMEPFEAVNMKKSCFYAFSSVHGTPTDFMEFVDSMHRAGIGVILDWNICEFSVTEHSLSGFDGYSLYTDIDSSSVSGRFDLSSRVAQSFLISNALYLADVFHIDGLRVEDLGAVLRNGKGRLDRGAVSLIRKLNGVMRDYYPDVMMITDDLFGKGAVTSSAADGLGFTFKWDSVCTRDTLAYASVELNERAMHTSELSAPLKHAFGEASVLTLTHADVVSGRSSFMARMPGNYDERFAGNRVFFTYMMTRPGKKMRFMGSEIGQFDEWDRFGEIQWFLLDYEKHAQLQLYLARLGQIYLDTPALWEQDCIPGGFSLDSAQGGVFAYRRFDSAGGEVAVALNFTPYRLCKYQLGVDHGGTWEEIISSDSSDFGGSGVENGTVTAVQSGSAGKPYSLTVDLPPLGAVVLKYTK